MYLKKFLEVFLDEFNFVSLSLEKFLKKLIEEAFKSNLRNVFQNNFLVNLIRNPQWDFLRIPRGIYIVIPKEICKNAFMQEIFKWIQKIRRPFEKSGHEKAVMAFILSGFHAFGLSGCLAFQFLGFQNVWIIRLIFEVLNFVFSEF